MSKFPTVKFNPEAVEPGKIASALKEAGAAAIKGDGATVMLPLDEINVFPDLNVRVTGKAWHERVDALAADMMAHGFMATKPLTVFTLREPLPLDDDAPADAKPKLVDMIYVADGHTRLAAAQQAIAAGAKLESVPAIFLPAGTTPEMVTADLQRNNSGEPLSPFEQSIQVARLKGFGRSEDEIAANLGKTKRYVQDLLVLSTAPSDIRNAVLKGEISASVAVREVRAVGGAKAAAKVTKAVEEAKAAGKERVSPSDLKGKAKQTGKRKDADADEAPKAAPAPAKVPAPVQAGETVPDDAFYLRSALMFTLGHGKPVEGVKWLRAFMEKEFDAVTELEKWMGVPLGSYVDPSLRVAEDDLGDL